MKLGTVRMTGYSKICVNSTKKTYSASNRSRLSGNFFHMTHLLKRCLACLSNNGWFYFVNEGFICLRLGEEHFSLLIDLLRVCRHR